MSLTDGKNFITVGEGEETIIKEDALAKVSKAIYEVLLAIAVGIAIIWGGFIGLQLMMQGAEGKAQMKEALIPYVIGCTVAFAAFGIWGMIVNTLQNTNL